MRIDIIMTRLSNVGRTRHGIVSQFVSCYRFKTGSSSSTRWLDRQKKDICSKGSKVHNYRSRAAFKLIEIEKKYRIFEKKTRNILDLGAAPGAWSQVAAERMNKLGVEANILGVDLLPSPPPKGTHFLQGNILSKRTHKEINEFFSRATNTTNVGLHIDLVVSDMMANTSGISANDHLASMELCDGALLLAMNLLKEGGTMVIKFFSGGEEHILQRRLLLTFHKVFRMKPNASRNELKEMYFICKRKKPSISVSEVFGTT